MWLTVSYKGRVENGRATHKTWRFLAPKFSKKGVYLAEVWLGDIQQLRGPNFNHLLTSLKYRCNKITMTQIQISRQNWNGACMVHQIKIFIKTTEIIYDFAFVLSLQLINSLSRQGWGMSALCYTRCGRVIRDFESEAKTRCNVQFR